MICWFRYTLLGCGLNWASLRTATSAAGSAVVERAPGLARHGSSSRFGCPLLVRVPAARRSVVVVHAPGLARHGSSSRYGCPLLVRVPAARRSAVVVRAPRLALHGSSSRYGCPLLVRVPRGPCRGGCDQVSGSMLGIFVRIHKRWHAAAVAPRRIRPTRAGEVPHCPVTPVTRLAVASPVEAIDSIPVMLRTMVGWAIVALTGIVPGPASVIVP